MGTSLCLGIPTAGYRNRFSMKDKAMLDKVKSSDQVEFSFAELGSDHTITEVK